LDTGTFIREFPEGVADMFAGAAIRPKSTGTQIDHEAAPSLHRSIALIAIDSSDDSTTSSI
jgi:hypothetical protein